MRYFKRTPRLRATGSSDIKSAIKVHPDQVEFVAKMTVTLCLVPCSDPATH